MIPRSLRAVLAAASAALAAGCAVHAVRPAATPPRSAVALALTVGAARERCRIEVERLPAGTMALALAAATEHEGLSGGIRAVEVEMDADVPVLVVHLSAPDGNGTEAAPERSCELAREAAARMERDPGRLRSAGAGPQWPLDIDAGRIRFRSVQRLSRGGRTEGFAEYWIGVRDDGTRVVVGRTVVLSHGTGAWRASDTVHVEDADAEGMLRHGRFARFRGGFEYRVELRRAGERTFAYAGEAKGRPVEGTFEASGGLATSLLRIDRFSERAGYGPAEPLRLETYLPARDATGPTPVVHRRDASRPRGLTTELGSRTASGVVDKDGTLEWMETADDPPGRIDTIWRSGAP